jgi:CP family cyanate transporter-like MFS transporter
VSGAGRASAPADSAGAAPARVAAPAGRAKALWLAAIVLVALNLRPVIASVPPLLDAVIGDLGLSATAAGLLTTVPVLCMGLFAPVGAVASYRVGAERVLATSVALIALGALLRALPGVGWLYAGTVAAGAGIAIAGALLPALVRARFPDRIGPVTGLYTAGLIGGAMLASAGTEPLRARLGVSWPVALALWAIPAVVALAAWLAVIRPARGRSWQATAFSVPSRGPWRDPAAWLATIFMGGQSLLYYTVLAWLAPRYTDLGFSPAAAGLLLGVFSAAQLISALGLPALAHRFGDTRPWIAASVGISVAMLAVIALVPAGAPWLWAGLLGVGVGGQFALALTVIADLGSSATAAARASGMAFFVGYLLAAAGPVVTGALHDLTGGFRIPFLAVAAFGLLVLAAGVLAGRPAARRRSATGAG